MPCASTSIRVAPLTRRQAAIVVRIRDERGREVQKLSQQYLLAGDAKDLEAAQAGEILFYREPDLPPGVYTMESIVFDAIAAHRQRPSRNARHSACRAVAAGDEQPGAGEPHRGSRQRRRRGAGPAFGAALRRPTRSSIRTLAKPIVKSATTELPFYFTLYGAADGTKAYAQLLRNGQSLAEAPIDLPPANGVTHAACRADFRLAPFRKEPISCGFA